MTARSHPRVIAMDGPAGSGKSSVSRGVAKRLGWRYLDTGAMYRAITWAILDAGVSLDDDAAIARQASLSAVESSTDPEFPAVFIAGRDVSSHIRSTMITQAVSAVSAVPQVRAILLDRQRAAVADALAEGTGIVVEGRDIGTVVLPTADLKIYLTADPTERARRRSAEISGESGQERDVEHTQRTLMERDAKDSSRAIAPLMQADDAIEIDTTAMSLQEVIDLIVGLANSES